jgi:probable O-glycosylation ligase (exosortase A-associated)
VKGLVFTYALSYGGAAVALFNPFIGLLIYCAFAILKPETMWAWSLPQGGYFSRIVAIALLTGWGLKGFGGWEFGRARGVVMAFVGLWLWSVLGAIGAANQDVAWRFVENMAKILLPFLAGITLIDSARRLNQLIWVLVLSQAYVALELNLSYYQGFNIVRTIGFAGDNNTVAITMATGAGLALFLGLGSERWWQKAVAFTGCLLMVHVVLFALSRGGMLALVTLGLVSFLLASRRPKHYLVLAAVLLLAVRLAGPQVRERFVTSFASEEERDFSAQSRVELWSLCWDLMLEHPLLGVGPDHFPLVVHEYGWPRGKEAHTLWLQTGAELGFPGLLFLFLLYGLGVARLWPLARGRLEGPDPRLRDVARMVVAALAGFAVSVQFVSTEGLELPYYVALVGAGVLKLVSLRIPQSVRAPADDAAPGAVGGAVTVRTR